MPRGLWLVTAAVLTLGAVLGLLFDWPFAAMGVIAAALDLYLLLAFVGVAFRSTKQAKSPDPKMKLDLPGAPSSLAIVPLLVVTAVFAFAGMYRQQTCGIIHTIAETQASYGAKSDPAAAATCIVNERVNPLRGRLDAVYFSAVTIMTVGYGDFAPGRPAARLVVIWEFATSLLLLVGAVPLVVSRLAHP